MMEAPADKEIAVIIIRGRAIIDAPIRTVFHILTDLSSYAEWNPWAIKVDGEAKEGEVICVKAGNTPQKIHNYQHRVLSVKSNSELVWCDTGWVTTFACAKRIRSLEALDHGRCVLVSTLEITGICSRLIGLVYGCAIQRHLLKELAALAARAELMSSRHWSFS